MPVLNVVILLVVFVAVAVRLTWVASRTSLRRRLLIQRSDVAAPPYQVARWRHGRMLVNPNDHFMGRAILEYGEYSESERRFLIGLSEACAGRVVEVGANIGAHTVPLAQALALGRRELIAFEPQPFVFQNLCANLALNGLMNVTAWPWACGGKTETVYFDPPDYGAPGNFGRVEMASDPAPRRIAVSCVRLDDVVGAGGAGLLKIDVEGYELSVLQGASGLLANSRPLLYVENDRVEKSEALIEWLWAREYKLFWHLPRLFNPGNFFKREKNIYGELASFNMLGVPRGSEKLAAGLEEIVSAAQHPLGR